jgi:iron complex outermembrane recepter protein
MFVIFRPVSRALARIAFLPACLLAHGAVADTTDLFFAELPVVATVSRLPQRLDRAPTSVTVIDRETIKASGARDLNDVFRLVPGFQTFPSTTESARVAYHGLNDEDYSPRVQVLVDGRSMYSPLFRNGVNWSLIPVAMADIERIEVVRGSNNVSYGSNAFLGVINIITVDPALTRGFSVATNYGNQGVRDYTLRAGGALGEAGNFRMTYEQKDDDGLTDRFDWRDFNSSRLLNMRADFQPTTLDAVELSLGRVEAANLSGRLQKSGSVALPVGKLDDPLRDYDQSSTFLQAQWRRALGGNAEFSLRYAFTEDWANDNHLETKTGTFKTSGVSTPVYQWVDAFGGRSTTHELEAVHQFSPLAETRVAWGGSWRHNSLSTPDYLYNRDSVERSVTRLFGNLEWQPAVWFTGNLGLAVERDSLAGTHTSPRISTNFHLNSENTIRLAYGKAYRTGSTVDYVGDRRYLPHATVAGAPIELGSAYRRRFLGDPAMPAEKLETYEIGYLSEWKKLRMSFDLRGFIEKVPNRLLSPIERTLPDGYCNALDLVLAPTCSGIKADYMTPIQSVKTQGVEYQWRWQPFDETRLLLSQAFIHISSEFLPGVAYNQRRELLTTESAPTHTTSVLLMQKLPFGLDLSLAGYRLGNHRWSQNTAVPSYQRLDGRLGYPFNWAGQRGELAYTVQSLDGDHAEYKGPNGNDLEAGLAARVVQRRHWVSLRLDF